MTPVFADGLFNNKTIMITGGGSGIGLSIAKELYSLGASVILAGRTLEKLETAAAELGIRENQQVHCMQLNIRDPENIESVCSDWKTRVQVDGLVNNAGGQFPSPAEKISVKGFKAVVETNLNGTFYTTQAVFSTWLKERGGSIVNILMNMKNGFPLMAHSGAARAGVDNLTKSLSVEWARYGIRINAVAPGLIRSSGIDTYDPKFQDFITKAVANNVMYRFGTERETALAAVFLLSPGASFITGQTLYADGGENLYAPLAPPVDHGKLPAVDGDEGGS